MKPQIHTSPVAEAFLSQDECPFCHLQRDTEQRAIRYFAGPSASYMEPGVRSITNEKGFCPDHIKKLYDYGNPLGSALMLQTYCEKVLLQLEDQMENYDIPLKKGLFQRKRPSNENPYPLQLQQQVRQCAICDQAEANMQRQFRVFFSLLKEEEFRQMVASSKGFCLGHFARLLQDAQDHLPAPQAKWFYDTVYAVMKDNLQRVKQDLDWFIAKYDYRNMNAPWGESKDALPRIMQKLASIYPTDAPYRKD